MTTIDVIKKCYPISYVQIFPKNSRDCIEYTIKELIDGVRNKSEEITKVLNLEVYGYVDGNGSGLLKIFTL